MNTYEHAMQIWSLLICAARERKSYTYKELCDIIKVNIIGVSQVLDPIYRYCIDKELPQLTILVVSECKTESHVGMPNPKGMKGDSARGVPAVTTDNVKALREEVFEKDWLAVIPQIDGFINSPLNLHHHPDAP